ncbi:VOC family metalloprotein YjdN [Enterobacter sp. 01-M-05-SI-ECC]|uniref:VOC family metalloprotein YjdN n=1 Tax=unclassified Enterobacter TaxID=2608935 RepID=UPI0039E06138
MPLSPYISFVGNCAEATAFYQQAVGAELLYKITFGEMPKSENSEEGCPSGMQFPDSAIAHSNVRIAGSDIMMSDGVPPGSHAQYAGFTLVLDTQDVSEGKRWFDNLAAGGNIEMAWQETFWAHGFGKVTDKYGVPWMINVVKQHQTS